MNKTVLSSLKAAKKKDVGKISASLTKRQESKIKEIQEIVMREQESEKFWKKVDMSRESKVIKNLVDELASGDRDLKRLFYNIENNLRWWKQDVADTSLDMDDLISTLETTVYRAAR